MKETVTEVKTSNAAVKTVRPATTISGYLTSNMPVVAVSNARISSTEKGINLDRPGQTDYTNCRIDKGCASKDQEEGAWDWFVDDKGNPVEVGKEAFLNPPKMFGLKGGRGIYA